MSITSDPHGGRIAVTPETESAASQPREANSGHHMSMMVIGLAVVARIMRDPRTHEAAILAVIAVAAAAGLGKLARLSPSRAWPPGTSGAPQTNYASSSPAIRRLRNGGTAG